LFVSRSLLFHIFRKWKKTRWNDEEGEQGGLSRSGPLSELPETGKPVERFFDWMKASIDLDAGRAARKGKKKEKSKDELQGEDVGENIVVDDELKPLFVDRFFSWLKRDDKDDKDDKDRDSDKDEKPQNKAKANARTRTPRKRKHSL